MRGVQTRRLLEGVDRSVGRFADAPARRSGSRRRSPAIRAQDDRSGAAGFGGKLQASPGDQVQFGDFADRHGEAAAAQPFLHRPKRIRIATRPHQDHPFGIDAENPQRRRVKLSGIERPGLHAPKDEVSAMGQPTGQQGAESRCNARVRSEHLVQSAVQKPKVRKGGRRTCSVLPGGAGRRIVAGKPAARAVFKHDAILMFIFCSITPRSGSQRTLT